MSLLVRAIKTSNSGLGGGLSGAIEKAEADKALYESNMTEFDTLLTGYESDANYLGKKSKTILTEYANAFENAIDMYSADPSKENKQRVDELKLITTDFYNKAVAARQNSLKQLQAVIQNPASYEKTLAQAQQAFAESEDADVVARFDPTTNQMYISQGDAPGMLVGEDGYYNGENPLFFNSRQKFGEIMAEGSWAQANGNRYINTIGNDAVLDPEGNVLKKSGRDQVIDAFVETGIYETSPYQETAIYNYINDVRGVSLESLEGEGGMRQLEQMILDIKEDPAELERALRYYGGIEADYIQGMASRARSEAQQERYDEIFSGGYRTRPTIDESRVLGPEGVDEDGNVIMTDAQDYIFEDAYQGAYDIYMFEGTGYTRSEMPGLEPDEILRGFNIQADGKMVILIDTKYVETSENTGDEVRGVREEFRVIDQDSDLYRNIENEVAGTGIVSTMIEESIIRKKRREDAENLRINRSFYEAEELRRRGGQVDFSGLNEAQLRGATTTQTERQQQREEEIRSSGSVRDTEQELALSRLSESVRENYYNDRTRKAGSTEFYNVPDGATIRGTGTEQDVLVNGEVIGEYVTRFNPNTGKYESLGMRPPQRSALSRFVDGTGRFFSNLFGGGEPEEFEYREEAASEVGSEPAQEATAPEQRESVDALSADQRETLQRVSSESQATMNALPETTRSKVEEAIGDRRDVFVKIEPNSTGTADLVIFVDSLGQELAMPTIAVESE